MKMRQALISIARIAVSHYPRYSESMPLFSHQLGAIVNLQGDCLAAKVLLEESLVKSQAMEDEWCVATSLLLLANLAAEQNDQPQGAELATASLAIFRRQRDEWAVLSALILLGHCAIATGYYAQGEQRLEEVLGLNRKLNPQSKGGPWALRILGFAAQMQGKYAQAADCYQRSLLLRQEQHQSAGMAWALEGLVEVATATGQP
jgi:tetratricopeptide (TPR) repeat protein